MISKFTKKYIIKQIKINNVKIPFNYEKTLIFYCKLIENYGYKLNYKKECNQKDKSDFTHPSWARRLYYAENYNFNEDLIKKIAEDVGCKNKKLIKEISEFYDEIILK